MKRLLATLTLLCAANLANSADTAPVATPDAEATRLLAEARTARAVWTNFPGFTADVEINFDGKSTKGKLTIDAKGKLTFGSLESTTGDDKDRLAWAEQTLGSIVGHRISSALPDTETPCKFLNADDANHPLGRAVQVLNDEFHSSYRIRDKQIIVVNRQMKGKHFTITVLEQTKNADGKYLSGHFVVNYWNDKGGELLRSETNHQQWTRVGGVDLPVAARVVTATPEGDKAGGLSARSVTLTNHKLLTAAR